MRRALLRCYPAAWRTRYGDEFLTVLEERPLGPFDVADVLLGALDAHLRLGAASEHAKGFAMSLRLGGLAAIAGGALWAITLAVASAIESEGSSVLTWILAAGSILLLGALIGLSAFQARRHPRLTWAAFVLPAIGAVTATIGLVAMAVIGDRPLVGDLTAWSVWALGTLGLLLGSALFGLVTLRTGSLSRPAAGLVVVGALGVGPVLMGLGGGLIPEAIEALVALVLVTSFGVGWTWLGVSALRLDRAGLGTAIGGDAA